MKNIYIFGSDKFKKNIKSLLAKNDIESYEIINSNETLAETIEKNPKECYLIDNETIYSKNILHKYIKYLIPKNGIEKSFLEKHSIGQLEFDSSQKAIDYINIRYNSDVHSDFIQDDDDVDEVIQDKTLEINLDDNEIEEVIEEEKPRDLAAITDINEIEASDLDSVISDIKVEKG